MTNAREVEFYDISTSRSLIDDIAAELTPVQMAGLQRNVHRLEQHGWALDGSFFDNVEGSEFRLREFRLTLDRVEYRILFSEEWGPRVPRFVMLAAYKEKRGSIPHAKLRSAEERLREWRRRYPRPQTGSLRKER